VESNPKSKLLVFAASKQAILRSERKDLLVGNQDNVYKWRDMYTNGLVFFSELAL